MTDDINAAPDYGDEPPIACLSLIVVLGAQFDCGGTPGHAGLHTFDANGRGILPKMHVEWTDEQAGPAGVLLSDYLRERGRPGVADMIERAEAALDVDL